MENTNYRWLRILTLLEQANSAIKTNSWEEEDKSDFYFIKDSILGHILKSRPEALQINLYRVPYYKYSYTTKDKAGALMRKDTQKNPFEHYLALVEPSDQDIEIPEKATIELEVTLDNRLFCFQIPQYKTAEWEIDTSTLPRKVWVSEKEFQKQQFLKAKAEMKELLEMLME